MTSPKQLNYAENRAKGMTKKQSAISAGLVPSRAIEEQPGVQAELARIRADLAKQADITKEDVLRMLLDAYDMAKLMADPQSMIAAAREAARMLGHYAPEVKKILTGIDKHELKKALENMSDEELLKLSNARTKTIEGQFTRIEDKSASTENTGVPAMQDSEALPNVLQEEPDLS